MRTIHYLIIVVLAFVISSCTEETLDINGKGTITGTVVQDENFLPLSNVKISTNPNTSTVFTDAEGKFTLSAESGTYAVKAEKDGFLVKFESADVKVDEEILVVFELKISTANNKPPPAATLTFPQDNASDIPFDVKFEWEILDPDGDSLVYNVQLRNSNTNTVQNFSDLDKRELETTLEFGTTYFWQVTSSDGINAPVNSVINSFTTATFPSNRFHFVRKLGDNNIIYSGDQNGNTVPLTPDSKNSWRPRVNRTVSKIAFLRNVGANVHVFTMDLSGKNVKQISKNVPVNGFNLDEVDISWSNNGNSIFYPSLDKLYRINPDGSGLTLIYQTANGNLITEVDFNNGVLALKTNDLNGYKVNIFTISESGQFLQTILSGELGAAGGIELSIDNKRLLYNRDVSGFQNSSYRQIDSRAFLFTFSSNSSVDASVEKPSGTNDLDVRFSPTDAQIIVTNRPNDSNTLGTIQKLEIGSGATVPRADLFQNSFMPDWE